MNQDIQNRFHIYTGLKKGKQLAHEQQAGEAYEVANTKPHYIIKMWAFPESTFFLCLNRDGQRFTLFGKRKEESENLVFRRPLGWGHASPDLKNHLEIQFTFPFQRVYMSLFPAEVTHDSLLNGSKESS